MKVVLLRFDAPLMSFGGVVVDHHHRTDPLPYRAMLAGLIANALGLSRLEEDLFGRLQARLRYAARRDRQGSALVDYHTVDLGEEGSMAGSIGWTTRGELEERKGGSAGEGTHIRLRHYLADAIVTVAFTLEDAGEEPSLEACSAALREPARPLFLGRKCCVPSAPVWLGEDEAESLKAAIERAPRARDRGDQGPLEAVWPAAEDSREGPGHLWARVEDRDPRNAIHVGRRLYARGVVDPPAGQAAEGRAR